MGIIRAIAILSLVFSSGWVMSNPTEELSFILDSDNIILFEFSEDGVELSDSNLPKNDFFNELEFIPKNPSKVTHVFAEKKFDSTSIKISLLIIPSLNLTKIIYPFHFFT